MNFCVLPKDILCLVIRKSCSLYIDIYFSYVTAFEEMLLRTVLSNTNNLPKNLLNPQNGTLTSTTTSGQSEPGSNGNGEVFHTLPRSSELEPHN